MKGKNKSKSQGLTPSSWDHAYEMRKGGWGHASILSVMPNPAPDTIWPSNPTAGHIHRGNQNWKDMCTPMFITELFIIARTWKQPRCPSADEWIRKLWYIYTVEYYSSIKKNTFESVLMRWMKLEPIIQNEVSQKEKHQYSILTHIYGI